MSSVQLEKLIPNTAYAISLYALYGDAPSDALDGTGVTCTYPAAQTHRSPNQTSLGYEALRNTHLYDAFMTRLQQILVQFYVHVGIYFIGL